MRKIVITALMILIAGVSSVFGDAVGSSFGCLTIARTLGMGSGSFGGGVGIADATSVFGSFNYGLSEFIDGRVKIGLVDADDAEDMELSFGADFKWQIWDTQGPIKREFDMAIGGFIEYCDFEVASVLELGGHAIGSYPFQMSNGKNLTVYGRFNIRMERVKIDYAGEDDSESDLRFGVNGGVTYPLTGTINIFGEFQIDGNEGLFLGLDFNVM